MDVKALVLAIIGVSVMLFGTNMGLYKVGKQMEQVGYSIEGISSAIRAHDCPKEVSVEEGKD